MWILNHWRELAELAQVQNVKTLAGTTLASEIPAALAAELFLRRVYVSLFKSTLDSGPEYV